MRRTAAEKREIIDVVECSELPAKRTLKELGIAKSTFYDWYKRFLEGGIDALEDRHASRQGPHWNQIPSRVRERVVETALDKTELSCRELACHFIDKRGYFLSESSVYRILKEHDLITSPAFELVSAADEFKTKTTRVHEMWQTDFTYFKVVSWGWYYLSTVLDDYSRFIISWRLTTSMSAGDVQDTLDDALSLSGQHRVAVRHRPRLLSDNGPAYISGDLRKYLSAQGMNHTRGRPYHPQTQGKIERYHRTMKNVVKLENYYFPGELERAIEEFVNYYNNRRYHEALSNCTPADVYYGRAEQVLSEREKIKQRTLLLRKRTYQANRVA